ncbi:MAG: hypothetical protein ACTHOP_01565 [Mesorhizobium sp.]
MFGLETYLIGGGAVFIVWLLTILKAVLWGASRERDKQKAKEADAYEQHLKELADAASAGAAVRPGDSLHDDPFNRD